LDSARSGKDKVIKERQLNLIEIPHIIPSGLVPYRDIVKENITLHEFQAVDFGNDYKLKVRIKAFVLLDKQGNKYDKGPCVSLQLFHGHRFLKALAIPSGKEAEVLALIEQAYRYVENIAQL